MGDTGKRRPLLEAYARIEHARTVPHAEVIRQEFVCVRRLRGRGSDGSTRISSRRPSWCIARSGRRTVTSRCWPQSWASATCPPGSAARRGAFLPKPYSFTAASHSTTGARAPTWRTSQSSRRRDGRRSAGSAGNATMRPLRRSRSARGCSGSKPRGTFCSVSCEPSGTRLGRAARAIAASSRARPVVGDRRAEARQLRAVHHVVAGADERSSTPRCT